MMDLVRAREALSEAEHAGTETERSVWLAKAADYAIDDHAVLVGGSAVNLHTQMYRPTDVDLCAYLDVRDREALIEVGFTHSQGDHFKYEMPDGEIWLLEFPDTRVDGTTMQLRLSPTDELTVITVESLVVDRIDQATDASDTTFDEAVRLCLAVLDTADWPEVERQLEGRHALTPYIKIIPTYERVMEAVHRLAGS